LGAIAGVFSQSQIDAPGLVREMLSAMKHRAQDGAAIAWNGTVESTSSPSSLRGSSPTEHLAVGYGFTRVLAEDRPQPLRAGKGWLCMDGRITANGMLLGGEEAANRLEPRLTRVSFPRINREFDGAYSLVYSTTRELLVTRDALGLKPLFIGERDGLVAVASERKALWSIGIQKTSTFPLRRSLRAGPEGIAIESSNDESLQAPRLPRELSAEELARLLVESVSTQAAGLGTFAIGFSGGLDSSILAKIAEDLGLDALLVTVGIGHTSEMSQAESAAKAIGLPIVLARFSIQDVEENLDRLVWLVEQPDLMQVSIAMAVHLTAKAAMKNSRSIIMLGQGSDELFGGYKRFATILGKRGPSAAEEAILQSIQNAHEVNYQRDDQAVSSLPVELRLPYSTSKMTDFALRVPLSMKVRSSADLARKWVLREAAIKLGIPSEIAMRPKRAIQHASGIEKSIREIARAHGQAASTYLENRLRMRKPDETAHTLE